VKEQIEAFANMFRRQVYGSLLDEKDVEDSLQAMRIQSKRLLHDNGMNFTYLLEELVTPPPSSVIPKKGVLGSKTTPPLSDMSINSVPSRFNIEASTPTPTSPRPSQSSSSSALANLVPPLSPSASGAAGQPPRPRPPRGPAPPRSRDRPPTALD